MLINLRNALMAGKRTPTAKDYVQNGLVAMWDGIENAGWGVHDAGATTWKDLVGNLDWTLGPATSYEWTPSSFKAKDQYAATRDFIDDSNVSTIEFCAKLLSSPGGNVAFIILGRSSLTSGAPYYGLLARNSANVKALMGCRSFFTNTVTEFLNIPATFSFPGFAALLAQAYFNGVPRDASGYNTLDYSASSRGTVARIGGILSQSYPIEVNNIRLYSRALTASEIAANYAIDKARFGLT